MTAIETSRLTKCYKGAAAVSGLELSVRQGELYALLGVNGAGKTTTIKMLCCLAAPSSGSATVLGDGITQSPGAVKAKINVSPQETAVAPGLSVRENLELMARLYGAPKAEARRRAAEMLKSLSLAEVAGQRAKTLSGGMQRRLSIAMALITRPKVLFLDEPTLGLDVLARRELWAVIRALKGKVTIILTTHYMEEAEALADRIGVMAKGRLAAQGSAAQLMTQSGASNFEDAFIALATQEGGAAV